MAFLSCRKPAWRTKRATGSLVAIEVESFDMWRPLGVVYRRHRAISPAQKQFVGMLKEARWMDNGNGTEPKHGEHPRRPGR